MTPLADQFTEVAKRLQEIELAKRPPVNIPAPAAANPGDAWREYLGL